MSIGLSRRGVISSSNVVQSPAPSGSMPIYIPNVNIDSAVKNVGNLSGVLRTPYGATVTGGQTNLNSAITIENTDFINTFVDVRAGVTFKNCRFHVDNFTGALPSMVRSILGNGVVANSIVFEDCEFHNRAQRLTNTFQGRNAIFRRCVFTGGVDGIAVVRQSGSIETNYQPTGTVTVEDCWIGDHGWWYHPTPGVIHSNDNQPHIDGIQIQTAGPTVNVSNTFFGTWPSEFVGTGTPGSGSETNPYSSTYTDVSQATMNSWRETYLNMNSRADQSFNGVSRKSSSGGGSWACVMINHPGIELNGCWFSGGGVHINAADSSLDGQNAGSVIDCISWNDMSLGRPQSSTTKGPVVYRRSATTVATTGSKFWDDASIVVATTG